MCTGFYSNHQVVVGEKSGVYILTKIYEQRLPPSPHPKRLMVTVKTPYSVCVHSSYSYGLDSAVCIWSRVSDPHPDIKHFQSHEMPNGLFSYILRLLF